MTHFEPSLELKKGTVVCDRQVVVTGAVCRPGIYYLSEGEEVEGLISWVKPLWGAKLKNQGKGRGAIHLHFATSPFVWISVVGELKSPGSYRVPEGLPYGVLGDYVPLEKGVGCKVGDRDKTCRDGCLVQVSVVN